MPFMPDAVEDDDAGVPATECRVGAVICVSDWFATTGASARAGTFIVVAVPLAVPEVDDEATPVGCTATCVTVSDDISGATALGAVDSTPMAPPTADAADSRACASSSAVWNRAAGSFSRQRIATASSACGMKTFGFCTEGGTGASRICLMSTVDAEAPLNGTSPESIS